MSGSIKLKHASGNGVIIAAPSSNPAADRTLTLPSDADGTIVSKDSANSLQNIAGINGGQLGNRNLIINGAMQCAQYGSSSTSSGIATVDRWLIQNANTGVTVTQSQQATSSSDEPYQNGFQNFARMALASAGTANTNVYVEFQQRMEAQNIANSGWNFKSSSSNITVSFWFRTSTNQTFYGYLTTSDGTAQRNTFSFTASGNNAWTKITKTFSGNSNLDFNDDNGEGLHFVLAPFYGTDLTNNKTLDVWAASDNTNFMPDMASTWLTAGASTFDVTGVQLEVGSATDFEHRSFGQELALCQRYYQIMRANLYAYANGANHAQTANCSFFTEMRAAPTAALIAASSTTNINSSYPPAAFGSNSRGIAVRTIATSATTTDYRAEWSLAAEL